MHSRRRRRVYARSRQPATGDGPDLVGLVRADFRTNACTTTSRKRRIICHGCTTAMDAPRRRRLLALGLALNGNQLDFKNERRIRTDGITSPSRTVGKIRGDEYLPFRTNRHQFQGLLKSWNDAADLKRGRLT